MSDQTDADGYSLTLAGGKLQVNLVKRWLDDALRVETAEPLAVGRWQHVAITYDGSRVADGVRIYVDGRRQACRVLLDELNQSFASTEPLVIGGGGSGPRFQRPDRRRASLQIRLPAADVSLLATRDTIDAIARLDAADRSPQQAAKLRAYYLEHRAPSRSGWPSGTSPNCATAARN